MTIKPHFFITFAVSMAFILFGRTGLCLEGSEHQIKAAMMVNFIKFVEWPDQAIDSSGGKIILGIFDTGDFRHILDPIDGKSIGGKELSIRYITRMSQLSECQVLFISNSESHRCYQILREVSGMPVLTIGEDEEFTRMGGMIRFYTEQSHVRFEINQTAALKSDLKLSAKLLEIAAAIH